MAITNYYVRPTNGADVAGQGTTHATAYRTPQFALDDIGGTHGRNAVDGDQVNLCDESANINAASLSLVGYGAPGTVAPLVLRGYTLTANDGGIGEIDCNGAAMWAAAYSSIRMTDLEVHSPGNNHLVVLTDNCIITNCNLHAGASVPVNKFALQVGIDCTVQHCYIPAFGTGASARTVVCAGTNPVIHRNYVGGVGQMCVYLASGTSRCTNNIIYAQGAAYGIYSAGFNNFIAANAIFAQAGNTTAGVYVSAVRYLQSVFNNIIVNFSGVGGLGVNVLSKASAIGNNAFYNNTANYAAALDIYYDLRTNDVLLAADPFVNAAAGNFMLTPAAQAVLRSVGWPSTYLGATLTDAQLAIGPVQYGEGGGGAVSISPVRGNVG